MPTITSRKRTRQDDSGETSAAPAPPPKSGVPAGKKGASEAAKATTGFGAALKKVLTRELKVSTSQGGSVVLAKRHTAAQKAEAAERAAAKAVRLKTALRRSQVRSRNDLPGALDKVKERDFRRVATKGVIALFNAVARHQHEAEKALGEPGDRVNRVAKVASSRTSFLNILQETTLGAAAAPGKAGGGGKTAGAGGAAGGGGAAWLSDGFVVHAGSSKGGRLASLAEERHEEVIGKGVGGLLDGGEF